MNVRLVELFEFVQEYVLCFSRQFLELIDNDDFLLSIHRSCVESFKLLEQITFATCLSLKQLNRLVEKIVIHCLAFKAFVAWVAIRKRMLADNHLRCN